jgi:hypothetical protein
MISSMATLDQHQGLDGKPVYRVGVRRNSTPTQTAAFPKLAAAKRCAQMTEGQVIEGRHFLRMKPTYYTLAEALDRYMKEVLPSIVTPSLRHGVQPLSAPPCPYSPMCSWSQSRNGTGYATIP